jgi:hypothetical protein
MTLTIVPRLLHRPDHPADMRRNHRPACGGIRDLHAYANNEAWKREARAEEPAAGLRLQSDEPSLRGAAALIDSWI